MSFWSGTIYGSKFNEGDEVRSLVGEIGTIQVIRPGCRGEYQVMCQVVWDKGPSTFVPENEILRHPVM